MKRFSSFFLLLFISIGALSAANGDTTTVRVFNNRSMTYWGNFDAKAKIPDASKKYQRIWLKFTLGCESNGQCEWDYLLKLMVRQHTGKNDSTLKQAPYLKVAGSAKDSVSYSDDTTWVNKFNTTTKKTDSVPSDIIRIQLFNNPASPLALTDSITGFTANYYRYMFDSTGKKTDSVWVPSTHTIRQKFTPYYEVFEVMNDFDLGRLISPYAKYFPKNFKYDYIYDVTDYVSLFNTSDSAEFRIQYQGYTYGFTATWDMIYVEGTPAREVLAVQNIYNGDFPYGQTPSIESYLVPVQFTPPQGTAATKARIVITGHGGGGTENCSEFCAKNYFLKLNNTEIAKQLVWKDDCGDNPITAQGGTWVYDRANWCPGEKIPTFEYWLDAPAGTAKTLDMDMEDFTSNGTPAYFVSLQLIHYKENSFTRDAAVEDIIAPSKNQWYSKVNPVCDHARIMIKNWGSQPLTRALISFRIGNGDVRIQEWAGNLKYGEEAEAFLPYLSWPSDLSDKTFRVWLSSVNGQAGDENSHNDTMYSELDVPTMLPSTFLIETKTNLLPGDNNYKITDAHGKVHYERTFTQANTVYRDTISLGYGCYTMRFNDAGGNGIDWWAAPGEGKGYVRFREYGTVKILKAFSPDFGNFIQQAFTVTYSVGVSDASSNTSLVNIFPSPASNVFFVEGMAAGQVEVMDITGKTCINTLYTDNGVNVEQLPAGIYIVRVTGAKGETAVRKINVTK